MSNLRPTNGRQPGKGISWNRPAGWALANPEDSNGILIDSDEHKGKHEEE
jgi:hypothetical protein